MEKEAIKKTWRNLATPFIIGLVVFIVSFSFFHFGSKKPTPQTVSLLGWVFGLLFMLMSGRKLLKFRNYLRSQESKE